MPGLLFTLHPLMWLGPAGAGNRMLSAGTLIAASLCFSKCLWNPHLQGNGMWTSGEKRNGREPPRLLSGVRVAFSLPAAGCSPAVALEMETEAQARPFISVQQG